MARIPVHLKVKIDELEEAYLMRVTINGGMGGDIDKLDAAYFEARESLEAAIKRYIQKRKG